jgi:hypothetical protein
MDVCAQSFWSAELLWLENLDGDGVQWARHSSCSDYEDPEVLSVCDIDGDGRPDFLSCSNEENSVAWWGHLSDRYRELGMLESSVLQITESTFPIDWGTLSWNGTGVPGTSLAFQVRGSDDPHTILFNDWSDTIPVSGTDLTGVLDEMDCYFQYKALLFSSTADTPLLEDVTVTWNELGVEPQGESGSPAPGLYPCGNPSSGRIIASFIPPGGERTRIILFDLAGRVLRSESFEENVCGTVTVEDLPSGLYCLMMRTGSARFTELLTVLP